MALELQAEETFTGTIVSGETEELEVKTATSDYIQVMLDGGASDGPPSEYTVTQRYYQPAFDDYMLYSTQTVQTARTIRTDARGAKLKFDFTNTSGADEQYRIVVQSFKEI